MPTVRRIQEGYRLFFFSNEGDPRERVHIHVMKGGAMAKVWLEPAIDLDSSFGFSSRDLRVIMDVVASERGGLIRAWHDYFGK